MGDHGAGSMTDEQHKLMKKPEPKPSGPRTSAMVDAWLDGKASTDNHRRSAAMGYSAGLHEALRAVIDMIEAGASPAQILERCKARMEGPKDWADMDHAERFEAQHLDGATDCPT